MKPKTMILLVVAVTCGLGASYMTSKLLAERKAPPPDEVDVVFSKISVQKYTILADPDKFFEVRKKPRQEFEGKKYFSVLAELKGKRINSDLRFDNYVSRDDIVDKLSGLPIPDGLVAIALNVTGEQAASFFVVPGTKVNVSLTERVEKGVTGTILRDILVVSVGGDFTKPEDLQAGTKQVPYVNLAVTAAQGNLLRQAQAMGTVNLTLRRDGDTLDPKNDGHASSEMVKKILRDQQAETAPEVKADPNKLPFGLGLGEIEKSAQKVEEPRPVELKPEWVMEIDAGPKPRQKVPFFKGADGAITRELTPPVVAPKRN